MNRRRIQANLDVHIMKCCACQDVIISHHVTIHECLKMHWWNSELVSITYCVLGDYLYVKQVISNTYLVVVLVWAIQMEMTVHNSQAKPFFVPGSLHRWFGGGKGTFDFNQSWVFHARIWHIPVWTCSHKLRIRFDDEPSFTHSPVGELCTIHCHSLRLLLPTMFQSRQMSWWMDV